MVGEQIKSIRVSNCIR